MSNIYKTAIVGVKRDFFISSIFKVSLVTERFARLVSIMKNTATVRHLVTHTVTTVLPETRALMIVSSVARAKRATTARMLLARVTVLQRLSVKLPISILLVVRMRNLPILMIDVNQCAKISDWVRIEQTVVLDRLSRDVTV